MSLQIEKAKSHKITEALEKEILNGNLKPGARIQSVRSLAEKFSVSIKVIQIVFDALEKKNLIERRHGSGTFVREIKFSPKNRIAFLFLASRSIEESYHFQVFRGISNELQRNGYSVDLTMEYDNEELVNNYSGIVFSSTISHDTIKKVMKTGLPCVVYGNVTGIKGLCEVNPDYYNGSMAAVDYLCKFNYNKIVFVKVSTEFNKRNQVCYEGYLAGLRKNGFTAHPELEWEFSEIDDKIDMMKDELKTGNYAFYIPNDATAFDISARLKKYGIKAGVNTSIVSFYNRNYAQFANPALTTIGFDHELMGRILAQKLCKIISGKKADSELIPIELILRQSVCNPQNHLIEEI